MGQAYDRISNLQRQPSNVASRQTVVEGYCLYLGTLKIFTRFKLMDLRHEGSSIKMLYI